MTVRYKGSTTVRGGPYYFDPNQYRNLTLNVAKNFYGRVATSKVVKDITIVVID